MRYTVEQGPDVRVGYNLSEQWFVLDSKTPDAYSQRFTIENSSDPKGAALLQAIDGNARDAMQRLEDVLAVLADESYQDAGLDLLEEVRVRLDDLKQEWIGARTLPRDESWYRFPVRERVRP